MRLYLVDSSIFIFRAWFARKQVMENLAGEENHAFIGFTDFVYQLLTEVAPSRLVFAFDESLKYSQRKSVYADYKANRAPAPPELKRQFAWCRQWTDYLGISGVASDRWEADDLIGTLASLHRSETLSIAILSADKDLAQLVREGDIWWSFYGSAKLDYRTIQKKFGVKPGQIAEQLALAGDKVDNIPGIPGIGMKTAANLLRKYGTLFELGKNLDQVSRMKFRYAGRVEGALKENWHLVEISKRLTEINCSVEGIEGISIERAKPDQDKLEQMMNSQAMDSARQAKWRELINRA